MLTAEAIVGSGTVPLGNDKLNPSTSSCECGRPALDLLPVSLLPRGGGNDKLNPPAVSTAGLCLICCRVSLRFLLGAGPAGQCQRRPR